MICLKVRMSNAHGRRQEESQEGMNQIIEGLKYELSENLNSIELAVSGIGGKIINSRKQFLNIGDYMKIY